MLIQTVKELNLIKKAQWATPHWDFSKYSFKKSIIKKQNFSYSQCKGLDFEGADLTECIFYKLNAIDTNFKDSRLVKVSFEDAWLYRAIFTGAILTDAILRDAKLNKCNFEQASLNGADLRGADLRGSNLCGADLRGIMIDCHTYFDGSTFNDFTMFPEGFNPMDHKMINEGAA